MATNSGIRPDGLVVRAFAQWAECIFFDIGVLGRFVCSALRFIPPWTQEKTVIPYIYNVSIKDPSKNYQRK